MLDASNMNMCDTPYKVLFANISQKPFLCVGLLRYCTMGLDGSQYILIYTSTCYNNPYAQSWNRRPAQRRQINPL